MDRYIGLDAQASSCTLGVVGPSGRRLGSQVVETNARALIEAVRAVPVRRHLCLEEGTLSGWLYEEAYCSSVGEFVRQRLIEDELRQRLRFGEIERRGLVEEEVTLRRPPCRCDGRRALGEVVVHDE